MKVHFVSVEVRIVAFTVGIMHSNGVFLRKYSDYVGHKGRLVESGLSVEKNYVSCL